MISRLTCVLSLSLLLSNLAFGRQAQSPVSDNRESTLGSVTFGLKFSHYSPKVDNISSAFDAVEDTLGLARGPRFDITYLAGANLRYTINSRHTVSGATNWSQKSNPLTAAGRLGIPTPNAAFEGNNAAFFPSDATAGNTTRLESPSINLSTAATPVLYFYYVNSQGTDVLRVRYSIDNGTSWNTITTLTTSAGSAWELHTISLAPLAGRSSVLLGFEAVADGLTGNTGSDIWLDGVYVRQ